MKLMASTPHRRHIFNVANFDMIKTVQKDFIIQVCAGVDDQLNSLVSGEEGKGNYFSSFRYTYLERLCTLLSIIHKV